jgi:hypothetical protein
MNFDDFRTSDGIFRSDQSPKDSNYWRSIMPEYSLYLWEVIEHTILPVTHYIPFLIVIVANLVVR